jgi:hypothetical protein
MGNLNAQLVLHDAHANGSYYAPRGCRMPALEDRVLARLLTFGTVLVGSGGAYLIETHSCQFLDKLVLTAIGYVVNEDIYS